MSNHDNLRNTNLPDAVPIKLGIHEYGEGYAIRFEEKRRRAFLRTETHKAWFGLIRIKIHHTDYREAAWDYVRSETPREKLRRMQDSLNPYLSQSLVPVKEFCSVSKAIDFIRTVYGEAGIKALMRDGCNEVTRPFAEARRERAEIAQRDMASRTISLAIASCAKFADSAEKSSRAAKAKAKAGKR